MQQDLKEFYHIKGDAPDPAGTGLRGKQSTIDLERSAIGHPRILAYAGHEPRLITADVYKEPGTDKIFVILYCPLCENSLRVHQDNKRLYYDPHAPSPITRALMEGGDKGHTCPCGCGKNYYGGRLEISEPFGCSWEETPELRRKHAAVCSWKGVVVARNVARK